MLRRMFLKSGVAGAAALPLVRAAKPRIQQPNFLFLIADDLTYRGIRALGNDEIHTPNLDRLVNRGCSFTHCFHQGSWSGAVCVPSRTMLNTGLTSFRAQRRAEETPLWGETLGGAGYHTSIIGKWHLSDANLRRSFKEKGPVSPGMFESGPSAYHRPSPGNTWSPWDKSLQGQWLHTTQWQMAPKDEIKHSAQVWAECAADYLMRRRGDTVPFFLYVGFNSPHDPRQAPKEYVDLYPPEHIRIPPNYLPDHPFDQGDRDVRDETLAPFPRTREAVQLHRSEYYAHTTYMDAQIGRILSALEKSGQAGNTYVIFTADHGLAVGQHGLMGKQNLYDHSIRMPLVISGPDVPRGRRVSHMVYQHSLYATTCELARVEVPKTVEFPSLVNLLTAGGGPKHDAVFSYYRHFQRAVRTTGHKLIVYPEAGVTQLFDLKHDPWETTNLSARHECAPLKRDLLDRLRRFQQELDDDLPAVTITG
jgi:arylsulfatase A-like enzyme